MKKTYIVVSCNGTTPIGGFGQAEFGVDTGNGSCCNRYPLLPHTKLSDLSDEDKAQVRAAADEALGAAVADKVVHKYLILFNRANARRIVKALGDTSYDWRIIELGTDVERDLRPVLHWSIQHKDSEKPESFVFSTRKATRNYIRDAQLAHYSAVPIYTAWRADPGEGEYRGSYRFRTKGQCEKWIAEFDSSCVPALHDEPVAEEELYREEWFYMVGQQC